MIKLFLFGTIWQFSVISYFYLNQEQITEEFCVNKDKPEMNCLGKCHVEKLLTGKDTNLVNNNQPTINSWLVIFQSFDEIQNISILPEEKQFVSNFHYLSETVRGHSNKIYTPPKTV